MTYLVSGAAGLIGSHLCEVLVQNGLSVVGIDNFNDYYSQRQKRSNVARLLDDKLFNLIEIDIRDSSKVLEVFRKYEPVAVAHLAAMANVRYAIGRSALYTDVNVVGSLNLLEASRNTSNPNFVFASTSSIYGKTKKTPFREELACNEPLSAYPATKKAIELMGYTYSNLHDMDFTAVRFFSVYGPRARPDMMPFMITDRLLRDEKITLFDAGEMYRDWTFVGDIVDGVYAAMQQRLGYEIINLGRGEPVKMLDFLQYIENLTGKKALLETPPAPASEPKITFADITKARALLGYEPKVSVQEGVQRMWDWFEARELSR